MRALSEKVHPAVFVTAGFFCVAWIQTVSLVLLPWQSLSLCGFAVLLAARDAWRLLRRMRFIFLALLILFAWQTPGTLMWPAAGFLSPTWDGIRAAIEPGLRLLGVLSVIALMLRYLSTEDWVSSLHVLVTPLRVTGFSPERFAVRLRLVLDYAAQRNLDWRHCLERAEPDVIDAAQTEWVLRALKPGDRALLVLVCVMGGWLLW